MPKKPPTIPEQSERFLQLREELSREVRASGVDAIITKLAHLIDIAEQLNDQHADLASDMRFRVKALENSLQVLPTAPLDSADMFLDQIALNAGMALSRDMGLHKLDYTKSGMPYRWTGPETESRFVLYVDRSVERNLSVNVCSFSLSDDISMRVGVDGTYMECESAILEEGITTFQCFMPKVGRPQPSLVTLETSRVWSPKEKNPNSKDERMLGVAFHSLLIS